MVLSWGRVHSLEHTECLISRNGAADEISKHIAENDLTTFYGAGRSYGDVALNRHGLVCKTTQHDKFIRADWETGRVRVSSGLTLDELLRVSVPKGWFVPVSPGTKFVTIGGAVANDVHGKNHHHAGSFGHYVTRLRLLRSAEFKGGAAAPDQTPGVYAYECSQNENGLLFATTIAGLGLTGFIDWVEVQLARIPSSFLEVENFPCKNLDAFFNFSEESSSWPYSVMWVDCFANGVNLGRGVFSRARSINVLPKGMSEAQRFKTHSLRKIRFPIELPNWMLNKFTISTFNKVYRNRPSARFKGLQHYDPFFYPLDRIEYWNKMYGRSGFFQHQSIIPLERAREGVRALLKEISSGRQGSFLAVLKMHGPNKSPGIMSFCQPGVSLALDFANKGAPTLSFLERLDSIVESHGGRQYPAKDGRMSAAHFRSTFPQWRKLEAARDPKLNSAFWKRVTQTTPETDSSEEKKQ